MPFIFRLVTFLQLAREQVVANKRLFLSAIDWYVRGLVQENKQDAFYVNNPDYSLVHLLRVKIKSMQELSDSKETKLLKLILNQYQAHLGQLIEKPWIRQDVVDRELGDLALLAEIDMVEPRKRK